MIATLTRISICTLVLLCLGACSPSGGASETTQGEDGTNDALTPDLGTPLSDQLSPSDGVVPADQLAPSDGVEPADQLAADDSAATDDQLGATIESITIGSQIWMAANLRIATPDSKCYGDVAANCETYGRLYSFAEALTACPAGWRLPTDEDWKTLEAHLGMPSDDLDLLGFSLERGSDEGEQLRLGGSSGFGLPMAGYATADGYFALDEKIYLWTATVLSNGQVIRRRVEALSPTIYRFSNPAEGFWISVRCIHE